MAPTTSVPDHPMRHLRPVLAREYLHEIALDLHRVGLRRPPEAPGQPTQVGVDGDAGNTEGVPQHDVGRLAADSGKGHQIRQPRGNLTAEAITHSLPDALQSLGLLPEESRGSDQGLQLLPIGARVVGGGVVALEQRRRHLVHALVSALGAEHRGDEEFDRCPKVQFTVRIRVGLPQDLHHAAGSASEGREFLPDSPVRRHDHADSVCRA